MTDAARNPDDYCYRHPDRLSFVLCEQCGRTICLECQTHVGGKVLCPDDARRSNVTMINVNARPPKPKRRVREARAFAWITPGIPIVTYSLLAILVIVFVIDTITRGVLGAVMPAYGTQVLTQPWTLITAMFYPAGILSLLLGGVNIFFLGRILEPHFGRNKFIVLYLVSGFGAAVFAFLLDGFSSSYGAIAGLIGALIIIARRIGANPTYLYISCAISAVLAVVLGGWQSFLGGIVSGGAIAFILLMEENDHRARRARILVIAVAAALLVIAVVRALIFSVTN